MNVNLIYPGNVFPGNFLSGKRLSGKVTFRETTVKQTNGMISLHVQQSAETTYNLGPRKEASTITLMTCQSWPRAYPGHRSASATTHMIGRTRHTEISASTRPWLLELFMFSGHCQVTTVRILPQKNRLSFSLHNQPVKIYSIVVFCAIFVV